MQNSALPADESTLRDWLLLIRAPGLGASRLRELLGVYGSPAAILAKNAEALRQTGKFPAALSWLQNPDEALLNGDIEWLQEPDRHFITCTSSDFPTRLNAAHAAPVALFVRGEPAVLKMPSIAMVGSRNPTRDGAESAYEFGKELAKAGLVIVSGMATGVDGAAHRGALDAGGLSVAVCGTGLDKVYPARHRELAHQLENQGAVVSEFPIGTPSKPRNFPRRNLTISGLSLGVLVVEAARQSGSLITARDAMNQNREVFAIPGSVHNPMARGCHQLIRSGAKLVETAADVLEELAAVVELPDQQDIFGDEAPSATTAAISPVEGSDPDYERILNVLGGRPISVDDIVLATELTADAVSSMLLIMELEGQIESRPGGGYIRCGA